MPKVTIGPSKDAAASCTLVSSTSERITVAGPHIAAHTHRGGIFEKRPSSIGFEVSRSFNSSHGRLKLLAVAVESLLWDNKKRNDPQGKHWPTARIEFDRMHGLQRIVTHSFELQRLLVQSWSLTWSGGGYQETLRFDAFGLSRAAAMPGNPVLKLNV